MSQICLYFGSFNPIHKGHLSLALYAREQLGFDEVWLILSPLNPQKNKGDQLPFDLRARLIRSALEGTRGIRLIELERLLPEPHYTVRTLRALRMLHPTDEFTLLIGADNLQGLGTWYEWERLLEIVRLVVYPRPGYELDAKLLAELAPVVDLCEDAPLSPLSSTDIRRRLLAGKTVSELVPFAPELLPLCREALEAHP